MFSAIKKGASAAKNAVTKASYGAKVCAAVLLCGLLSVAANAQVTLTIPTEMDPMTLVNNALAALAPIMLPALSLVAIVGVALGFVRFVWGSSRRAGKGG